MAPAVATYAPRDPSRTVLYHVIAEYLETFLASLEADPDATGLPAYVRREFYDYLQCGILAHGFSLHANTQIPAHRRDQLERLIRYTARGAVSLERLTRDANGDLVYTFTHPWSDGTTGIRLSPLERVEKLAALVPLLRVHLVRYGGCLAPHSHLRGAIIPTPRQQGVDEEEATDPGAPR
ncbi:MAG TPA: transposase [Candidatus Tectomicrobia bacterium]